MSNTWFAFKQFTVYHDQCSMKVGTDGVLLGAWVNLTNASCILDVGTGTGLVALMCAQRSAAFIDAVETDEIACLQAKDNFQKSPWHARLRIIHDRFQHFAKYVPNKYDLVVSNPPFFRNSLKPGMQSRLIARHDDLLGYEDLIKGSSGILKDNGRLAVIIPFNDIEQFSMLAHVYGLFPERLTIVKPDSEKKPIRYLAGFSKNDTRYTSDELIIRETPGGNYTNAFQMLTKDFYLNFKLFCPVLF
jgi:tRNA1Val (adenine37-N6)-methyltransferase